MCAFELRPHHGLCTLFFTGKGYSEDFTRNMAEIIRQLGKEDTQIILTDKEDCICAACPKNNKGCESAEKVRRFDSTVLELCGLSVGETITAGELYALVRRNILDSKKLAEVCPDCQWFGICSEKE